MLSGVDWSNMKKAFKTVKDYLAKAPVLAYYTTSLKR
jgi:hypothetical protein